MLAMTFSLIGGQPIHRGGRLLEPISVTAGSDDYERDDCELKESR